MVEGCCSIDLWKAGSVGTLMRRSDLAAGLPGGDIHDGDDRAVNFVLNRAIRKDFELIVNAQAIRQLSLKGMKIRDHLYHECLKIGNFDAGIDIGERAADVPGN